MTAPAGPAEVGLTCPNCGAERIPGATFCEACAFEFTDVAAPDPALVAPLPGWERAPGVGEAGAPPRPPAQPLAVNPGDESPLDVGWTGPVQTQAVTPPAPVDPVAGLCRQCGVGHYLDGYCDTCGAKEPDPRDHLAEAPAPWVAGVCDIGKRHRRNEDALALAADPGALSFAALVVCDGVSNTTDSHLASLAAARAARSILTEPLPHGVGTREAVVAAAGRRLDDAVAAAERAVVATSAAAGDAAVANPPSCTFVAALVVGGTAIVGNVGDSRAYWLPDDASAAAVQLSRDDSFAAEQMSAGIPRKDAETGAGAHAITRWLGVDSPDDISPHLADLDLDADGWLLVCSDGLWNYCSEADDLSRLVRDTAERLGESGQHPPTLAQALVEFANERGGADNITVALARVGPVGPAPEPAAESTPEVAAESAPELEPAAPDRTSDEADTHTDQSPATPVAPDTKDAP